MKAHKNSFGNEQRPPHADGCFCPHPRVTAVFCTNRPVEVEHAPYGITAAYVKAVPIRQERSDSQDTFPQTPVTHQKQISRKHVEFSD